MLVKRVAGSYAKKTRDYVIGAAREAFVAEKDLMILVMGAMGRLVVLVVIGVC
jgi:hypothetical protein